MRGTSLELHLEPVLGLELEMELFFFFFFGFIQPNSSLVFTASFDSARLVGQIRLTVVGGTMEISRPMWEMAMSMGAALGRTVMLLSFHPQDSQRVAYCLHSRCSLSCHESTDSHDNAKLQPQMLCYHLASPAQRRHQVPYVNAHQIDQHPVNVGRQLGSKRGQGAVAKEAKSMESRKKKNSVHAACLPTYM